MAVDLSQFAVGGAQRPDSFSGMNPAFSGALAQLFAAAPEPIRQQMRVSSGYRSPERQAQLYAEALKKYGSPQAARKWVAPPGNSQHNHGHAADLKYLSPDALKWAHANAGQYGLKFPLGNENWHIELASTRGGKAAPVVVQNASVPAQAGANARVMSPTPIAQQGGIQPGQAAPAAFGDVVAPKVVQTVPIDVPSFGDFVAERAQVAQLRQQEETERQRRRALLFASPVV